MLLPTDTYRKLMKSITAVLHLFVTLPRVLLLIAYLNKLQANQYSTPVTYQDIGSGRLCIPLF
jgi:hypothetical protein